MSANVLILTIFFVALYSAFVYWRAHSVRRRMDSFRSRGHIEFERIVVELEVSANSFITAKICWLKLANLFAFHCEKCMRPSDRLCDLMNIHNAYMIHHTFEDVYEVLEAINVDFADFVRELKVIPISVGDIIKLACRFEIKKVAS